MVEKLKWKIASIALITIPIAIWFNLGKAGTTLSNLIIFVGFLPLFIAIGMELKDEKDNPEKHELGSPAGNKIAKSLSFIIFIFVIWGIIMAATK